MNSRDGRKRCVLDAVDSAGVGDGARRCEGRVLGGFGHQAQARGTAAVIKVYQLEGAQIKGVELVPL